MQLLDIISISDLVLNMHSDASWYLSETKVRSWLACYDFLWPLTKKEEKTKTNENMIIATGKKWEICSYPHRYIVTTVLQQELLMTVWKATFTFDWRLFLLESWPGQTKIFNVTWSQVQRIWMTILLNILQVHMHAWRLYRALLGSRISHDNVCHSTDNTTPEIDDEIKYCHGNL